MSTRWNVIVAALEGHAALVDQVRAKLSHAWSAPSPCLFTAAGAAELQAQPLRDVDAVVFIGGESSAHAPTLALLSVLDEAAVPVLALLDGRPEPGNPFEIAGAIVEPLTAHPARLVSLLHGLLHRQREIKRLREEVALNQRFHGGLRGEIAKMHEELQLAALVQREFLPRELPSMHGVEFAALWKPTHFVSGDIYDLVRLDEDHVGVFIADAVGHGMPAALMTMVICRSLITKEIIGNSYRLVPPSEVLARLNLEMIRRQGRTTRFATAVYAVIDCRERVVQMAKAGHPPPLLLAADGTSQLLESSGGLLGVFPDETYKQIELDLEVGDRLLFYTDGFEQAFPGAPGSSGAQSPPNAPNYRYRTEFDQLSRLPGAAEMIQAITRKIDEQIGSIEQIDDLTMICVKAGPLLPLQSLPQRAERTTHKNPRTHGGDLRLAS
ncbi:MAG: PP2C family protein-serine/threonine phosphatase [Phycisphaerales bacterium]|nr:PP2C family protein-serine/threonine phosphatase [Phycisphaerales bacterium]MCI0630171.1 PP2C family protein-serine/threonine phosphatase [Phycisphaerales bacterium]MCI0674888.1 PP2C family protein-serine/threonine phosphatase [Phycisphaerales bacterium]